VALAAGPDVTDAELLARYRAGNVEAFRELYQRYARALLFYARGDEDAVQEAFVRLLDRHDPAVSASAQAFLYTTVRNLVLDEKRKAAVRRRAVPALVRVEPDVDPEAVSAALDRLPDDQREAVVLKTYAGLTFEEIAKVAGAPAPTVMSRYRYALEKLASLLRKP